MTCDIDALRFSADATCAAKKGGYAPVLAK
jgi:hypothetical protein